MRDDIDREPATERTGSSAHPPADGASRRIGWLRLAGVATHVLRLAPEPSPEAEDAALDLLCEASVGPVFRAGPGVVAFRPEGDPDALAAAISEALGETAEVEEIAPPQEPEDPADRRSLVFVGPSAQTLQGEGLVLDAALAIETAEAAARAVESHAGAAVARLDEAADRLAGRLDGLGGDLDAARAETTEALARLESRIDALAEAQGPGSGALEEALATLAGRLDGAEGRLGEMRPVMERVSRALDDLPDIRKERDGLLMYAANMRFILDNLDGQATRLAGLLDRADRDLDAASGGGRGDGLAAIMQRLDALEGRVEAALDARDASGDHVRTALAELLACERRRRVAEVPRDDHA